MSGSVGRAPALRHQLPVLSPISLSALAKAVSPGRGDAAEALGEALREEYHASSVRLCGSGTQALQLSIEAAIRDAPAGAPIALPAFGCYDIAAAAVGAGVSVLFYDIDPATLSPDPATFAATLRAGAAAAVIAPLYGIPVDWSSLRDLASRHGALLVEDAAQGQGGRWNGTPLGGLGDVSVLSFGRGKGWTGGGGGAVLLRSPRVVDPRELPRATLGSRLAPPAVGLALWGLGRPSLYGLPRLVPGLGLGETRYREPTEPSGIAPAAAALALATRPAAVREAERRRAGGRELDALLAQHDGVGRIRYPAAGEPGFLRYPLLVPGGIGGLPSTAEALRLGAAPSYPRPLPLLPQIRHLTVAAGGDFPGARQLARDLITLPTHSRVRPEERLRLVELVARSSFPSIVAALSAG